LIFFSGCFLHSFVARSAGAFGDGPSDVVEGALSLAGFAVEAVRGIGGFDLVVDGFVYAGGAEGDAGAVECRSTFGSADIGVYNGKMRGLVFPVLGCGPSGEGIFIELFVAFEFVMGGGHCLIIFFDFEYRQEVCED